MTQKKYKYKHLTDEMKKLLDEEIKKIGRSELYKNIEHNIRAERIINLQNEEGAFRELYNGVWRTTMWEYKYSIKPLVIDMNNLDLGLEMLYYIDSKKFLLLTSNKNI